jgi:hypothetical protein
MVEILPDWSGDGSPGDRETPCALQHRSSGNLSSGSLKIRSPTDMRRAAA